MLFTRSARRRPRKIFLGLVLKLSAVTLACSASGSVHADPTLLSLSDAQRLAEARSSQLLAQDRAIDGARDMAVAAGQLPDPVIKAGIDNLPVSGKDRFSPGADFMTMRRIGVMQEWTRSDKRQLRAERYEREAEKSIASKSVNLAAIQRDTALAWFDLYYADAMAKVIDEESSQAALEIQASEGAYRAGRGSQADIYVGRSAKATADDRISTFQRRVRNAKTNLARWIGSVPVIALAEPPATDVVRLHSDSLETQLAHHPEIAVLAGTEDIARTEAKLARANKTADWSVDVAFQQRGPGYSNMVSIGVSVPLQWNQKNRQDRELSAKLALIEQAKAEREEALRAHVAETRTMLDEWENNRERQARYQHELIPLARERVQATVAAYRGGKATLAELLVARRSEIDIRIQALQLQWDTARLWAQLNFLFPADLQHVTPVSMLQKDHP